MATPPTGPKEAKIKRLERVAFWRLRGLTVRAIEKKLGDEGLINPKSGKPWARATIHIDLKALSKQWQQEASKSTSELKARQIAEIGEALRVGWATLDSVEGTDKAKLLNTIRALQETLIKILGTAAPTQTQLGGMDGSPLIIKGYTNLNPDEWPE